MAEPLDWEVPPAWYYDGEVNEEYALWAPRSDGFPLVGGLAVAEGAARLIIIAPQNDLHENFSFREGDIASLDKFIERLKQARDYLARSLPAGEVW